MTSKTKTLKGEKGIPPHGKKTKTLLVKMIYTALAVGSALWGGERLMVETVRARYKDTLHMNEALERIARDEPHKAKVQAYLDKRIKISHTRHHQRLSNQRGNVGADLNLCLFNFFNNKISTYARSGLPNGCPRHRRGGNAGYAVAP